MDQAPTQFDPLRSGTAYTNAVVLNVYDTLYRYRYLARPYQLAPNAASDLPEVSADGLRYRIKLRAGLRFADDPAFAGGQGREVVAEDVVYSFKRHFHKDSLSEGAWLWQDVLAGIDAWRAAGAQLEASPNASPDASPDASWDAPWDAVVALDARTVEFRLHTPFPQLPFTLTQGYSAIVAREAVEKYGADFALHPVGSGPYRLTDFDGRVARLSANAHFRRPPLDLALEGYQAHAHAGFGLAALAGQSIPILREIELHFVPDHFQRSAMMRRGELDYVDLKPGLASELGASEAFKACCHEASPLLSESVYVSFNMADPELGESPDPAQSERRRALRCAITKGYDWSERNRVLYGSQAVLFRGLIPPSAREFDPAAIVDGKADAVSAKQLLAKHGWSPEAMPVLRWASPAGNDMQQAFELFRGQMLALGFPPEKIRWQSFPDFGAYLNAVNEGKLMLMDLGWNLDYPDALSVLQLYYGPNAPPQVNSSAYRNKSFDAAFERARALAPGAERDQLYRDMNQIASADCAAISGLARTRHQIWRKTFLALPDREMIGASFLRYVMPAP